MEAWDLALVEIGAGSYCFFLLLETDLEALEVMVEQEHLQQMVQCFIHG